jgi:hypothetical protein
LCLFIVSNYGTARLLKTDDALQNFVLYFHRIDVKVGLIDYIIKIVGGAVTFGLIAIALRGRFERKYTH